MRLLRRMDAQGAALAALALGLSLALTSPAAQAEPQPKKSSSQQQKKSRPQTKTTTPQKSSGKKTGSAAKATPEMQSAQKDLVTVQQEIRQAQKALKLTQAERAKKEAELKKAEVQIGGLKKELRANNAEVAERKRALSELQAERRQHEANRVRQLAQLKRDVEQGYRRGGQDYFKLVLNQEQPALAARQLKYYAYIQQARSELIQHLDHTVAEINRIEAEEKTQLSKLDVLQDTLEKQQQELSVAQEQRNQAISVLSTQIETQDEKLRRLKRDQAALQSVMQKLEREARDAARREAARQAEEARLAREKAERERQEALAAGRTPPPPKPVEKPAEKEKSWGSEPDFNAKPYSGKCPLPVGGGIAASFGSARAGGLRWNGVLISAPAGSAVRAVKGGRVVYADYLRGYGFLIILDHGRGLMSLYGQNQSLLKKVGEQVAANDSIALVGASGGNEAAGLYFEIRLRGRPSNPTAWCSY